MLFYQHNAITSYSVTDQIEILLNLTITNGGYNQLAINSYNASYIISSGSYSDDIKEDLIINNTNYRDNAFNFCNGECSLITLHTYNTYSVNETNQYTVSPYLYQIPNGSCNDIYSITDTAFIELATNAPVKFTEDYYECYPHVIDALIDSIGIGSGNASMYVPLIFAIILPFLYLWLDYIGIQTPSTEYNHIEKSHIWEHFIISLLRAKELKTKGMIKNNKKCGLISLVNDIENVDKRSRKHNVPDSVRRLKRRKSIKKNIN